MFYIDLHWALDKWDTPNELIWFPTWYMYFYIDELCLFEGYWSSKGICSPCLQSCCVLNKIENTQRKITKSAPLNLPHSEHWKIAQFIAL